MLIRRQTEWRRFSRLIASILLAMLCTAMLSVSSPLLADGDIDIAPHMLGGSQWIQLGDLLAVPDSDDGGFGNILNYRKISVEAAEFSPDDLTIISGGKHDGNMRKWDVATGNMLWDETRCSNADCEIEAVGYTKDGLYALFAGEENGVGIFVRDATTGALVRELIVAGQNGMDALRVSNDGTMVASAGDGGLIHIWDITNSNPSNWSLMATTDHTPSSTLSVNQIDWTLDDNYLISCSRDGTVVRIETTTWTIVQTYTGFVILGGDVSLKGVRVSNDYKYIASGGKDNGSGRLIVWEYDTGNIVFNSTNPQGSQYEAVEFTDDSQFLFVGGTHGSSRSSAPRITNGGKGYINIFRCSDFAVSPAPDPIKSIYVFRQEYLHINSDETLMVSSHEDGTLRLWDVFDTERTQIAQESFNETSAGGRYTKTGSSADWGIYNGEPSPGNPQEFELFGYQLQGYFSSDNLAGAVHTMTLNPVDVSGKGDVRVGVLLAAGEAVFEATDYLDIEVDLNNTGAFQTIAHFEGTGGSDLSLDGAGVLFIKKVFQEFEFNVPAGGTDMVIRVSAKSDANNEEFGFDNIRVTVSLNAPPAWNSDPLAKDDANENQAYVGSLAGNATDPEAGGPLTFSQDSGPSWLTIAPDGTLFGSPAHGDIGSNSWDVTATDIGLASSSAVVTIQVLSEGDFNANGYVDGGDLDEWKANYGSLYDGSDFLAWQRHYTGTPVTVPNVVDMVEATAESTLTGLGLTIGPRSEAYDLTIASGNVISSNPAAGAQLFTGNPVSLEISLGPPPTLPVGDYVGQDETTAEGNIVSDGLTVGTAIEVNNAAVAGTVIDQSPTEGTQVAPGSQVILTVSLGPVLIVVLEENTSQDDKMEAKDGQDGAQSFKHGTGGDADYEITSVELLLSRESSSPSDDLHFTIGTSANGGELPGSHVHITPGEVTNTSGGSSFATYTIVFASPVGPLTAGTTYYLNFETDGNGKAYFLGFNGSNNYGNGTYYKHGSNENKDMFFKIFGSEVLPPPLAASSAAGAELPPAMLSASNDAQAVVAPVETDSPSASPTSSVLHPLSASASAMSSRASGDSSLSLLIIKSRLRQVSKEVREGKNHRAEKRLQELLDELNDMLSDTAENDPQRKRIEQLVESVKTQLAKISGG